MRRIFLIWLLVLICAALAVTGGVSYWLNARHEQAQAEQFMATRLHDLLELVDFRGRSIARLVSINDESALARARAFAEIVRLNPDILHDQEELQGICNELGAEQVSITDASGNIIASVPGSFTGFDIARHASSQPLLDCIRTPGVERIVRPQGSDSDSDLLNVGVHRHDAPGLVRVGFLPYHEYRAREASAFGRLAANYRLGSQGRIVAFHGGSALNREALPCPAADLLALPVGEIRRMDLRGQEYFFYALERDGYRLVGLLPRGELDSLQRQGMRARLVTSSVVFLTVFILLSFLLQRYVLSGMERVNLSLRRIAEGKLDERVDVATTPEFAKLSTGINSMLDALKLMGDREQERMRKELDTARFIQRNALPAPFPEENAGSRDFALAADLIPAATVGGDFYDYYLSRDGQQLTFTVAEVTGTGVPAALLMMRSLSLLHSLRSRRDPAAVAEGVNKALCEGRTEELYVRLFHGILDIPSGLLSCVNAGYQSPLVQHVGQRGYHEASLPSCPPLGKAEDSRYLNAELRLEAGDRLFLYSAGLLHMQNPAQERFGSARLAEYLAGGELGIHDCLRQLRTALNRFVQRRAQEDDATLFLLEFRGMMRRGGRVQVLAGAPQGVRELLSRHMESVLAAPLAIEAMQAAVARVLATLPADTETTVTLGCNEEKAELIFTYPGIPLNPLQKIDLPEVEHALFSYSEGLNNVTLSQKLG